MHVDRDRKTDQQIPQFVMQRTGGARRSDDEQIDGTVRALLTLRERSEQQDFLRITRSDDEFRHCICRAAHGVPNCRTRYA